MISTPFPCWLIAMLVVAGVARPVSHARAGDPESLESRLRPLIDAHKGRVAVAVKHLETGESFQFRADEPMPTASLIKFPVMIESYRQAESGRVDLGKFVTLKNSDKVPGSGILTQHFSEGATFPLRDAVRLMIAFSDNTATNLVLDEIGIPSTGAYMAQLDCPNTRIYAKVYKRKESSIDMKRSERFGLGSTTANEMIHLLGLLHARELVSKEASAAMLEHLRACDDKDKFPRFLPPETKIAFKTGSLDEIRTAAGIIETPGGPVAVCVLSEENEDHRWVPDNAGNRLCAEVAKAVFARFNQPSKPAT